MKEPEKIFSAKAMSVAGVMQETNSAIGFRIPEYQRAYDWSEKNVERLIEDCVHGLSRLQDTEDAFTFLGTIILVKEDRDEREGSFDGISRQVVDGQQRLTSLTLIAAALLELLVEFTDSLAGLPNDVCEWLEEEGGRQQQELFRCVVGELKGREPLYFPKIVRTSEDQRARDREKANYQSRVAKFSMAARDFYIDGTNGGARIVFPEPSSTQVGTPFEKNFEFVRRQLRAIMTRGGGIELELIPDEEMASPRVQALFRTLPPSKDDGGNQVLAEALQNKTALPLVRSLLFSSYLNEYVVLTQVVADSENAAFDIFDSLNTTGEPLTAIETLKPRVIQEESSHGAYNGSISETAFSNLERLLSDRSKSPSARQAATKELVISFALFLDGTKMSKSLSTQRSYLRKSFSEQSTIATKRRYIKALDDVATFRERFWYPDSIDDLGVLWLPDDLDKREEFVSKLKLGLRFVADMKTSVAVPVVARYWVQYRNRQDAASASEFLEAVLAVSGYIALRRAATGGTGSIDGAFRRLMKDPSQHGPPISMLGEGSNPDAPPGVANLKAALLDELRTLFGQPELTVANWMKQARTVATASASVPLTRFLLLAAHDRARHDDDGGGLVTREDYRYGGESDYLNFTSWVGPNYKTVEHVAPVSKPSAGWPESIYERPETVDTLGNLTLLPQVENASLGNRGWKTKRLFYQALSEDGDHAQRLLLQRAEEDGIALSQQTRDLITSGKRLPLVKPLASVDEWTSEVVEARTQRLLRLAWERVMPWLTN